MRTHLLRLIYRQAADAAWASRWPEQWLGRKGVLCRVDEGRKRVIGIIAGILVANHITWLTIYSAGHREIRGLTR